MSYYSVLAATVERMHRIHVYIHFRLFNLYTQHTFTLDGAYLQVTLNDHHTTPTSGSRLDGHQDLVTPTTALLHLHTPTQLGRLTDCRTPRPARWTKQTSAVVVCFKETQVSSKGDTRLAGYDMGQRGMLLMALALDIIT